MNRRGFLTKLGGIGLFSILPGAGRIWKARRWSPEDDCLIKLPPQPIDIQKLHALLYKIKRQREARVTDEKYEAHMNSLVLRFGTGGVYETFTKTYNL